MSGFTASAGRMSIVNPGGDTVFDTDEGLFAVTDSVSGTVNIPARKTTRGNNTGSPTGTLTIDTNHSLSTSINTSADMVRGTFTVTTSQGAINSSIGIFNAGGSYLHYQGMNPHGVNYATHTYFGQCVAYTFIALGGNLDLNEHCYLQAWPRLGSANTSVTILAVTIEYNLLIGTFV